MRYSLGFLCACAFAVVPLVGCSGGGGDGGSGGSGGLAGRAERPVLAAPLARGERLAPVVRNHPAGQRRPAAPRTDLFGVSFTDANTGTAVGDGGIIVRTTDGGTTWANQSSGTTDELLWRVVHRCEHRHGRGRRRDHLADDGRRHDVGGADQRHHESLYGVSFTDANTGTAVGEGGTILRTTDGATTWAAQTSGTTSRLMACRSPMRTPGRSSATAGSSCGRRTAGRRGRRRPAAPRRLFWRVVHRCEHRDGRGRRRDHLADDGRGDDVGAAEERHHATLSRACRSPMRTLGRS